MSLCGKNSDYLYIVFGSKPEFSRSIAVISKCPDRVIKPEIQQKMGLGFTAKTA
jgi:hypothetical protein